MTSIFSFFSYWMTLVISAMWGGINSLFWEREGLHLLFFPIFVFLRNCPFQSLETPNRCWFSNFKKQADTPSILNFFLYILYMFNIFCKSSLSCTYIDNIELKREYIDNYNSVPITVMLEFKLCCTSTENFDYSSFFMACYREFQDKSYLNYGEDRRFRLNFTFKNAFSV